MNRTKNGAWLISTVRDEDNDKNKCYQLISDFTNLRFAFLCFIMKFSLPHFLLFTCASFINKMFYFSFPHVSLTFSVARSCSTPRISSSSLIWASFRFLVFFSLLFFVYLLKKVRETFRQPLGIFYWFLMVPGGFLMFSNDYLCFPNGLFCFSNVILLSPKQIYRTLTGPY